MTHKQYKEKLADVLPNKPGVYRFIGKEDVVLYVGKAKDLKKRVASYFGKNKYGRIRVLVKKAVTVAFTIVETEQDAFLLENSLIKKYQPRYNIQLKDDKSYPYICIKKERFPRVFLTRRFIKDGSEYLGPYTSVRRVRTILELLKNIFPLRTCNFNLSKANIDKGKFKLCLEYHLGNCLGPCEDLQSEENYNEGIAQMRKILKGHSGAVVQYLKEEMKRLADNYEFEKAATFKNKLDILVEYKSKSTIVNNAINNVDVYAMAVENNHYYINCFKLVEGTIIQTKIIELMPKLEEVEKDILSYGVLQLREQMNSNAKEIIVPFEVDLPLADLKVTIPQRGDKLSLLQLANKNVEYYRNQQTLKNIDQKYKKRGLEVLAQLKSDFRLTELPVHIECFDISNLQGSYPVASMVVFKDGKPANKDYRHFNIKTVTGPDDFASMEEVVYRRYKRLKEEALPLPQLIIIDGGKGQLSSSVKSLKKLDLYGKIAIAGIAKRLEEIYMPEDSFPLLISKKSPSLKLVQKLRNEAHRFAITFHRKKRSTGSIKSEFTDIRGIGSKSIEKLYQHFKSYEAIRSASVEALSEVLDKNKAVLLAAHFKAVAGDDSEE